VTFPDSAAPGAAIHAALGPHRRAQRELGGNHPGVVQADADLARAAAVVAASPFNLSGQACTGAGRILVAEEVHDELVERVAARARALVLGPGDRGGVTTGPPRPRAAVQAMAADRGEAVAASPDA